MSRPKCIRTIWVLRSIIRGRGKSLLDGHVFESEHDAYRWIEQEYVQGDFYIEEWTAEWRPPRTVGGWRLVQRVAG